MPIDLPSIARKANVVAILLIIKVIGYAIGNAVEHTRLVNKMLGEAGEVSELTKVRLLGILNLRVVPAEAFAIRFPRIPREGRAFGVVSGFDFLGGDFGLVAHRPHIMPKS